MIEGIVNQSTSSNTEDRIAKIVLAKKTSDESGVHLDENLEEIRKLLRERNFDKPDKQEHATPNLNIPNEQEQATPSINIPNEQEHTTPSFQHT